jgi:hypothetical protein
MRRSSIRRQRFREQGFLPMMAGGGGQEPAAAIVIIRCVPAIPVGVALVTGDL